MPPRFLGNSVDDGTSNQDTGVTGQLGWGQDGRVS